MSDLSRVQFAPATTGPANKQCRQCGTWLRPGLTRQVGLWPCRRHPGAVTPALTGAHVHGSVYACCGLATTMHPSRARQLGLQERDLLGCTPCDHDFAVARPGRPRTFGENEEDQEEDDQDDQDEDAVEATETMPARVVLPAGDADAHAVALTFNADDMEKALKPEAADEDELEMLLDSARAALWTTYSRPSFLNRIDITQKAELQARASQLWEAAEKQRGNYGGTHTFGPRAAEQPTPADMATAAQLAMIETLDDARIYAMRQLKVRAQLQLVHLVKPTPDDTALARIAKAMRTFNNA